MINIAEMPKYQTYKDSTEGWIGDVPEHWDIRKLKHLFYEKKHRPNMSLNSGAISFGKVVTKDDEKILLSTKASYQEVLSGEFLINPLNLNYDLISLRIALSEIDVVVSAGYIVIKEKEELQKQYFKYLLHRYDVAYMKLLGSGVRQTISFNHIANSLLVFPPLEEQSLIANYLEKKTAQVDEAIAIKEQQISLLKERKQIIIQQAVTQGLDPNVPMKDSGVDWIGKVPAHWEVRRSKFVFTQRKERAWKDDVQLSATQAYGVIPQDQYEELTGKRVVKIQFHLDKRKHVEKDDFVISMRSFQGGLERAWSQGCIRSSYVVLRALDEIDPSFYGYLLKLPSYIAALQQTASFIRDGQDLNFDNFSKVDLFIPPIEEQKEIANYVSAFMKSSDEGIELLFAQIEKLKEYKTSLINSAVTGKIKITPEMIEQ
ncbi:restriction endonuclease subunit S [Marinomonas sp. UCMA 3892]|uniref:restriction endonuclease subunit S n=1 Tax=Gammaproteobacteria TaxID=1236 RepID=UPI00005FBD95|nr:MULTISPECIES: restriction endonuclease subunit S [Gammaproteobacteria]GHX86969.1 Type I restriction-modification system, specificity subunit S [Vibrio cholerae]ABM23938.1 putative type I site-specific restriction-modification system, S subunit [Shewanella sp. W3-18-1]NLU98083.1 restriction endonuclease subunit S [Marinomonas sp. UCMA 3892]QLQ65357.1 restriction endonuclease subunit S [Providencia rettgeri]UBX50969.1 restriction endonuclease subunit S [Providencia alcalifaciens]